ncbi:hypothetical protein BT69DRAFT_607962 [Atractiella rhizophila]|nr:hypothetical protein BT69DRAFT_607962 [Atractiella rhizophila]
MGSSSSGATPGTGLLLSVFIRDGVLYFIVLSICKRVKVVFFSLSTESNPKPNAELSAHSNIHNNNGCAHSPPPSICSKII